MKTNELMVGDWVLADYKVGKQVFAKIGFLDPKYADREHDNIGFLPVPMVDDLEQYINDERSIHPIPLTEEILEANFGEKEDHNCGEGYYFYSNNGGENCVIDGILIIGKTSYYEYNLALPVHYVHQLQHALRLCGLEEIANNFVMP